MKKRLLISGLVTLILGTTFILPAQAVVSDNAPQDLRISILEPEAIEILWNRGKGSHSQYNVELSVTGDPGTYVQMGTVSVPQDRYAFYFTNLKPNTAYWFRVIATNSAMDSDAAASLSFVATSTYAPKAPFVKAEGQDSVSISITPGDGNPEHTEYSLREATTGLVVQADGTLGSNYYKAPAADWNGFKVTGLQAGTEYRFGAISWNANGVQSGLSPFASVTTVSAAAPNNNKVSTTISGTFSSKPVTTTPSTDPSTTATTPKNTSNTNSTTTTGIPTSSSTSTSIPNSTQPTPTSINMLWLLLLIPVALLAALVTKQYMKSRQNKNSLPQ